MPKQLGSEIGLLLLSKSFGIFLRLKNNETGMHRI